ncbi:hypothetical protein Hypma_008347 [Hypsizygus marmoreus]|uniref:Uncharacterized protein n=1 Tax=Hypsizygus marmoreus TaxID=39966 RepID=A0A369JQM6_HYPMA|nr:hypothetical protein Hypma_008347 [Hypsizygus marmoreus]
MRLPRGVNRRGLPAEKIYPKIYQYGVPIRVKPSEHAPKVPGTFVHYNFKMMTTCKGGGKIPYSRKKWWWKCIGAVVSIRRRPTKGGYMRGQRMAVSLGDISF